MSREADFHARAAADTTLVALLTGGIYKSESIGVEGITRETAPTAFDGSGYLRPCALVRQRALIPDGFVRDEITRHTSAAQVVEIWLYEDRGYSAIDAAAARLFTLFQGYQFADSAPVVWAGTPVDRERDMGALKGASMARMDWIVYTVRS